MEGGARPRGPDPGEEGEVRRGPGAGHLAPAGVSVTGLCFSKCRGLRSWACTVVHQRRLYNSLWLDREHSQIPSRHWDSCSWVRSRPDASALRGLLYRSGSLSCFHLLASAWPSAETSRASRNRPFLDPLISFSPHTGVKGSVSLFETLS